MKTKSGRVLRSRVKAKKARKPLAHLRPKRGSCQRQLVKKRGKALCAQPHKSANTRRRLFPEASEDHLNKRDDFKEYEFVQFPSWILIPLLKWKRVIVDENNGHVAPLDSGSNPLSYVTPETTNTGVVEENSDDFIVVKNENEKDLAATPAMRATPKRCQANGSAVAAVTKTDAREVDSDPISRGSTVYAVYFGTYYPAIILSAEGVLGYQVRFINDNVVKSVPHEAVLSPNLLRTGVKCLVNTSPDEDSKPAVVRSLPQDLEAGAITVAIQDADHRDVEFIGVRWHQLSFPVRFWRSEIARRTELKTTPQKCRPQDCIVERGAAAPIKIEVDNSVEYEEAGPSNGFAFTDVMSPRMQSFPETRRGRKPKAFHENKKNGNGRAFRAGRAGPRRFDVDERFIHRDPRLFYSLWPKFPNSIAEEFTVVRRASWPQSMVVSSFLKIFPATSENDRTFIVTLEDRKWHCHYRVRNCHLGNDLEARRFKEREEMIKNMKSVMEKRNPVEFNLQFSHYHTRLNFQKEWRVSLRIHETMINRRLRSFGIAPIFIESWTRNQPSMLNFDYLPRSTLSVRLHRELVQHGAILRYIYPERTAGCGCPERKCVVNKCPCLVYKKNGCVMMCGQACGCDDSCPSAYLKEERQIPLVLFNTRHKGWGVLTPVKIPAGTFLGLYAGHMTTVDDYTLYDNTYVFDINDQETGGASRYAIDGTWSGNISRFFNHSCVDPTLVAKVLLTRGNMVTHDLAFFTTRDIDVGEELVFCYSKEIMQQRSFGIPCSNKRTKSGCTETNCQNFSANLAIRHKLLRCGLCFCALTML